MNSPEGVILVLVGVGIYRRNSRVKIFAALLAVLNGLAGTMALAFSLSKPVAFLWVGIWIVVFVTMRYVQSKTSFLTARGTAQTA
jgi:hypothetical protein